jgi:hypothetical protein
VSIAVGFSEGVTDGQATVGPPGVRLTVSVALDTLTAINWGDGQLDSPPDISGDFVAHIYRQPAARVSVEVEAADDTGTSPTFEVVAPEPGEPEADTYEEAQAAGYSGQPPDPRPNEDYTVEGVSDEEDARSNR